MPRHVGFRRCDEEEVVEVAYVADAELGESEVDDRPTTAACRRAALC